MLQISWRPHGGMLWRIGKMYSPFTPLVLSYWIAMFPEGFGSFQLALRQDIVGMILFFLFFALFVIPPGQQYPPIVSASVANCLRTVYLAQSQVLNV